VNDHARSETSQDDTLTPQAGRFGTFGGVFTPSVLTILGVVMYMRFGWVVGHQGLAGALLVVLVSHMISLATGLSVASIATNRTVGAGGAYYMISRSLGAPAGAAIGIPLFLGQALGVTFYIVGFTESITAIVPGLAAEVLPGVTMEKVVGTAVVVGLTALSIKSAELAIKAQFFVMIAIAVSLVSFFMGTGESPPAEIAWTSPNGKGFTEVFAVFFPAVTGIMAGVSMSGDLKDPRRSIPRGTLSAILVCMVVYLVIPFFLVRQVSLQEMQDDLNVVWKIAAFPSAIYVGVWAATLSSALASVLTAPRTLQALAQDGHVPRVFGRGYGKNQEPVAGLLLTFALAETGIILGNLDVIAPVLTMFFLVTYGFTNLACGLERWAASPSFRPDFKVPAAVSLFGALACFYVMSIINMAAMFAALLVCSGIYLLTQRRVLGTTYGDARHGIWSALVRSALHHLQEAEFHPLNWRPNLLILGGHPDKRAHLLRLGSAMVQERGIVSYAHLVKGTVAEHAQHRKDLIRSAGRTVSERFPNVFYRVDIVEDIYRGIVTTAQAYGVGSLESNAVLVGWPRKVDRRVPFLHMLDDLTRLDRSVILVHHKGGLLLDAAPRQAPRSKARPEIHIWWGGLERNGGLMLLLAFLLTADMRLRNARVRLMTVVNNEAEEREASAGVERVIRAARLTARARVIRRGDRSIPEIMREESASCDLAIVGFKLPEPIDEDSADTFFDRMNAILAELPTTLMVHSARDFESEPVLFDES
jgi:amino acid transporter